jgi:ClpP class serine protease
MNMNKIRRLALLLLLPFFYDSTLTLARSPHRHPFRIGILSRGGSTRKPFLKEQNSTFTQRLLRKFQGRNATKQSVNRTSGSSNEKVVVPKPSANATTDTDTKSPVVQQVISQKKTGWFQQRKPWNSETQVVANATTEITSKEERPSRRWKRQRSTNTSDSSRTNATNVESVVVTGAGSNETASTAVEPNGTAIQPPLGSGGVIVIGTGLPSTGGPHPQYYPRGQIVPMRATAIPASSSLASPTNSATLVLLEFLTSIIGKAMYLWFFTWLTKRIASQEEGMIQPTQHYVWERLNDRYSRDAVALQTVLREPPLGVSHKRWHHQHARKVLSHRRPRPATPSRTLAETFTRTVVVVELGTAAGSASGSTDGLSGSFSGSQIDLKSMPDVVSFLLQQQLRHAFGTAKDTGGPMPLEIVFIINSPGGEVSTYGLAAAQMQRFKNQANITTTVCVDKYAASGGFMIASQADRLIAAPFATIGSVGVILEGLNFYELAKRYGVQPLVLKAGDSKNPLSQWGPVSRQDIEQEQGRLVKVHEAFKELVLQGRPKMIENAKQVTDGSVYLGLEAQTLGLVDSVMTTDEYIFERIEAGDRVLRLHRSQQGRFSRQLRLSPLDILPHLRSMGVNAINAIFGPGLEYQVRSVIVRLAQTGTWMSFFHFLLQSYNNKT